MMISCLAKKVIPFCMAVGVIGFTPHQIAASNALFNDNRSERASQNPADYKVVYKGEKGPGLGKNIVFIASDHEYRSEESLPALARIMAKRYGFTCTVLFGLDQEGYIHPGSSNLKGLEILDRADLLVLFTRFLDIEDQEMSYLDQYVKRGMPIVAFRTATHAFHNAKNEKWGHYGWNYKGDKSDWTDGFGERVLGETWVSHYGTNHKQSSRILIEKSQQKHPVLKGVSDMWVQSGGYTAYPKGEVLAKGEVLNGMTPDAPADPTKELLPVVWTKTYQIEGGKKGKSLTTTHGASEDILNPGFRRLAINGMFWAMGMEKSIKAKNNIDFVGPYTPTTFNFDGYKTKVKPADLAGWDSLIMPGEVLKKK
jgi:hypothetical protein